MNSNLYKVFRGINSERNKAVVSPMIIDVANQLKNERDKFAFEILDNHYEYRLAAVEAVDPDWRSHYHDELGEAFRQYWNEEGSREQMVEALFEGIY